MVARLSPCPRPRGGGRKIDRGGMPRRLPRVPARRTDPVRRHVMTKPDIDITLCDREPIHIPGSVQPHGVLLVVDPATMAVTHAAGDLGALLGRADWRTAPLADLLGADIAIAAKHVHADGEVHALDHVALPATNGFVDARLHGAGSRIIVELEPAAPPSPSLLPRLESIAAAFERAPDLQNLLEKAAV